MAASSRTHRHLPFAPLLTGAQVGHILGVTPRQIRTLAAAGELRRVVLGHRSTRYLVEDVEAYIERHTAPHNDVEDPGKVLDGKERDAGAHRSG